jgi:vitamin B12 transporter
VKTGWTGFMMLVLGATGLGAQSPAEIRGRIVEAGTGAPVAGARITAGASGATSAADGRFVLGALPPGRLTLEVVSVGYRPYREDLDLLPGIALERTVQLVGVPVELEPIVVQAPGGASASLDREELVRRGADLARALDGWEGVVVRRTGPSGPASPQVRGSAPDEVLVVVDGFALNDPLTGRADLAQVASRDVATVRLFPGARTSSAGGRAIAGVIEITSYSDPRPTAAAWGGSHGAAGAGATGELLGVHVFAEGERSPRDYPYEVPANRGSGEAVRTNTGGELWQLSLRKSGGTEVQLRGSASDRGLPGPVGNETPHASAQERSLFAGLRGTGALRWGLFGSGLYTRAQDAQPPIGAPYDVETQGWSAGGEAEWQRPLRIAGWRGSGVFGGDLRVDEYEGDALEGPARWNRAGLHAGATLASDDLSAWTLTPAVRLEQWTGAERPALSARVDATWHRAGWTLSASGGNAVVAPPLTDLFFREGVGVALNPDLRPERVRWEAEFGVSREWPAFGRRTRASLRAWYGRVDDMILWAPGVNFVWSPRNQDVVRRGIEGVLAVAPAAALRVEAQAAWTPVTYDVPGGAQVQYRPRGTAALSASWSPGSWSADARWHWIGERYPNPGGVNPRPAMALLDVGVERRIGSQLLVRGDIRDLLDTRAEFIAGYPMPGRSLLITLTMD